jgi:hypothetical protein
MLISYLKLPESGYPVYKQDTAWLISYRCELH